MRHSDVLHQCCAIDVDSRRRVSGDRSVHTALGTSDAATPNARAVSCPRNLIYASPCSTQPVPPRRLRVHHARFCCIPVGIDAYRRGWRVPPDSHKRQQSLDVTTLVIMCMGLIVVSWHPARHCLRSRAQHTSQHDVSQINCASLCSR